MQCTSGSVSAVVRRRRVSKLLDPIFDPTPDRHTRVITGRRKLLGTPVAMGFDLVTVSRFATRQMSNSGYHAGIARRDTGFPPCSERPKARSFTLSIQRQTTGGK